MAARSPKCMYAPRAWRSRSYVHAEWCLCFDPQNAQSMVAERAEIAGCGCSLLRGPRRTAEKDIRRDAGSALYCRPIGLAALWMCLLVHLRCLADPARMVYLCTKASVMCRISASDRGLLIYQWRSRRRGFTKECARLARLISCITLEITR
jgi:hypothetical protein